MPTIPDWSRNVNPFRRIRKSLPRTALSPVLRREKSTRRKNARKKSHPRPLPCAKKSSPFLRPCTKNLIRSYARVEKTRASFRFAPVRPFARKKIKQKPLERGLARSIEIEDDAQDDEHRSREEKERPEVHQALGQRRAMTFTSLASYSFTSGSSSSSERTFTRSLKTSEEMTTPLPASVSTSAPTRGTRLFLST